MRQKAVAPLDFQSLYVRFGSIATLLGEAARPFMSAMPPIATKAVTRGETSRCAKSGLMHCSKRYCDLVDHLVGALLLGSQFSQRERGKLTCEYPRAASGATDRAWAACRHFSASPPIQTNRTRIPHIPSMITVATSPARTAPPTINRSASALLTPCAIMTARAPAARCARTKNAPSQ